MDTTVPTTVKRKDAASGGESKVSQWCEEPALKPGPSQIAKLSLYCFDPQDPRECNDRTA